MSPAGFEPTISVGQLPQIRALDRAATGTGFIYHLILYKNLLPRPKIQYKYLYCLLHFKRYDIWYMIYDMIYMIYLNI